MGERILSLPLMVILMGIGATAMYIPAAHAATLRDFETMRAFFQSGNLFLILTIMLGIATSNRVIRRQGRSYLLALLAAFVVLPLMLAVPFSFAVPDTIFLNAYIEMVSGITTTGATLFDDPGRLPPSVHLWRALVGWMGGFLMLVAAVAILAPMNLGGYEVMSTYSAGRGAADSARFGKSQDGSERLRRYSVRIFPIYGGLTLMLWIVLLMLGDPPLVAISHAMSVLSTSGISPIGGLQNAQSGLGGEAIIFVVLTLVITRQNFGTDRFGSDHNGLSFLPRLRDSEFQMAMLIVTVVTAMLFMRHWVGAFDVEKSENLPNALRSFWGGFFTVLSFLSTTGFESAAWTDARNWSGFQTPGIILMGLALIGGGVATTAGGVKLMRVYVLYKHGFREMERLVHPSSVGGAGSVARRLRRQGAHVAWIFFMLFALGMAGTVTLFTLTGVEFETAVILAVAALSTTGPLVSMAGHVPVDFSLLSDASKIVLGLAMVLGRLETLAIIALLNPEFWRR